MYVLVAASAALSQVPVELGFAWAQFSRAPAARLIRTEVEVGTLGYDSTRKRPDFWLRRTVVRGVEHKEEITWADSRTCAAARPVIASMREIPVPKFAPIGSSDGPPVILDGIAYSLRTYSDEGTLAAETNLGTPLAAWVEGALKALDSCWTKVQPRRTNSSGAIEAHASQFAPPAGYSANGTVPDKTGPVESRVPSFTRIPDAKLGGRFHVVPG